MLQLFFPVATVISRELNTACIAPWIPQNEWLPEPELLLVHHHELLLYKRLHCVAGLDLRTPEDRIDWHAHQVA